MGLEAVAHISLVPLTASLDTQWTRWRGAMTAPSAQAPPAFQAEFIIIPPGRQTVIACNWVLPATLSF